ncbi:hypothetical protein GGF31_005052 [Allomyces arbusculus]|nr:hypothetical protein GGF31_005052 [Allomyces arbusculus]
MTPNDAPFVDLEAGDQPSATHQASSMPDLRSAGSSSSLVAKCPAPLVRAASAALKVIDCVGLKVADMLGLTSSRYSEYYEEAIFEGQQHQKHLIRQSLARSAANKAAPVNGFGMVAAQPVATAVIQAPSGSPVGGINPASVPIAPSPMPGQVGSGGMENATLQG